MTNPPELTWLSAPCRQPSTAHATLAEARQAMLTKPTGSLGRLEEIAVRLAAIQHTDHPHVGAPRIVVFAGDHGVTAQNVSAFPSEVTVQMVANFTSGGAAICVLAREIGATLEIVDAGTLARDPIRGAVTDKPRCGTADITELPAMTTSDLAHALAAGRRAVDRANADGADVMIFGEMGIGNTTVAAAIAVALTDANPEAVVGRGTGVDDAGLARKIDAIRRALSRHAQSANTTGSNVRRSGDPLVILESLGGLEIAAITGGIVRAVQLGLPVLVDGFIVSVAALAATRINREVDGALIYAHRSEEAGHGLVLDALGARPLLDLGLRLGEASGAAAAFPLLRLACALHNEMATFAEAAIAGRSEA